PEFARLGTAQGYGVRLRVVLGIFLGGASALGILLSCDVLVRAAAGRSRCGRPLQNGQSVASDLPLGARRSASTAERRRALHSFPKSGAISLLPTIGCAAMMGDCAWVLCACYVAAGLSRDAGTWVMIRT